MKFENRADGRMACPFDHHAPSLAKTYRAVFDELRQNAPLAWSDAHGGFWTATSYDLVRQITLDAENFTVDPGPDRSGGIMIPAPPGSKNRPLFVPGEVDGADHDKYRIALSPHFTPRRVAALAPLIERHVGQTIDRILELRDFDVVNDLCRPILCGVACEHLGIEVDNPVTFIGAIADMVSHHSDEEFDAINQHFGKTWYYLVDVVKQRRAAPRDDVISHLAKWTDPVFTDEEVQMMALNVILGAADTTISLITQAIIYLQEHPDLKAHLQAKPEDMPKAVDEFLRLLVVSMGNCRTAVHDVEIAGVTIKAGDRMLPGFAAANHDPAKYPDPWTFDLERRGAGHLGMGAGAHFCLGAWLAKSITAITLREVLARLPKFHVPRDTVVSADDVSILNHFDRAPATTGA